MRFFTEILDDNIVVFSNQIELVVTMSVEKERSRVFLSACLMNGITFVEGVLHIVLKR